MYLPRDDSRLEDENKPKKKKAIAKLRKYRKENMLLAENIVQSKLFSPNDFKMYRSFFVTLYQK